VSDLIEGFMKLMSSADEITGPVNLGNATEFTIGELAELVIGLTNSRSRLVRLPLPADDPRQRRPDISLAHKELGWQPGTPLDDGLKDTIQYFKKLLA